MRPVLAALSKAAVVSQITCDLKDESPLIFAYLRMIPQFIFWLTLSIVVYTDTSDKWSRFKREETLGDVVRKVLL